MHTSSSLQAQPNNLAFVFASHDSELFGFPGRDQCKQIVPAASCCFVKYRWQLHAQLLQVVVHRFTFLSGLIIPVCGDFFV